MNVEKFNQFRLAIDSARIDLLSDLSLFETASQRFNRREFEALLIRAHLDEHTENLWRLGVSFADVYPRYLNRKAQTATRNEYLVDLTKSLLFLTQNQSPTVKFSVPRTSESTKNQRCSDLIRDKFLSEFKKNNLHRVPMSAERGSNELLNGSADNWKKEYHSEMKNRVWQPQQEYAVALNDIEGVDAEMVAHYILTRTMPAEIDAPLLQRKLNELKRPAKKGAPSTNYPKAYLLGHLLLLFDDNPTNVQYRFVFDYCKFFGLYTDELPGRHQYIKAIHRSYREALP